MRFFLQLGCRVACVLLPVLAVPLTLALAECGNDATEVTTDAGAHPGVNTGSLVAATVSRDVKPQASSANESALVTGNDAFALSMYHAISSTVGSTTENLFYSPYSLSLALAMAYAGAGGETATQMAAALQFSLPESALNPAFDALDLAIESHGKDAKGDDGASYALDIANSLWGDKSIVFQQSFVNTLAQYYGAPLRAVDFMSAPSTAENEINAWVSENTGGKIPMLLGQNAIPGDTAFLIVNAIYFNAGWKTAFDPTQTRSGSFTQADGTVLTVPMMESLNTATSYGSGSNWQAVELPYSDESTSMVIVLPNQGAYATVEQGLSGSFFAEVTSSLSGGDAIDLTMPRFTVHGATMSLKAELQSLGMTDAFAEQADFLPITATPLHIRDVLHQAFISVDESGTVAAAATAGEDMAADEPISVAINSTFFFCIRDVATNSILFVGRVDDPTSRAD